MRSRAWGGVAPGLLLAFAGCAGGLADPEGAALGTTAVSAEAAPPQGDPNTGIRGYVQTDELLPIVGATVAVGGYAPVTTEEDGSYEIRNLVPGPHRILVEAPGFSSTARTVDVGFEEIVEATFVLVDIPDDTARVEFTTWKGRDDCRLADPTQAPGSPVPAWYTYLLACSRPNLLHVLLEYSWAYLVVEVEWDGTNSFKTWVSDDGACNSRDSCYGIEYGESPIRIEGAPLDSAIASRWSLDGKTMYPEGRETVRIITHYIGEGRALLNSTLNAQCREIYRDLGYQQERFGCPMGVGYSYGLGGHPFTYYVSIFHFDRPASPGDYTAIP